jgi:hypothetical protein
MARRRNESRRKRREDLTAPGLKNKSVMLRLHLIIIYLIFPRQRFLNLGLNKRQLMNLTKG